MPPRCEEWHCVLPAWPDAWTATSLCLGPHESLQKGNAARLLGFPLGRCNMEIFEELNDASKAEKSWLQSCITAVAYVESGMLCDNMACHAAVAKFSSHPPRVLQTCHGYTRKKSFARSQNAHGETCVLRVYVYNVYISTRASKPTHIPMSPHARLNYPNTWLKTLAKPGCHILSQGP